MKTICLLGANLSTGNMGVAALFMGALKALNHAYPEARFFILDYSDKPESYHVEVNGRAFDVPFVNIRFSKKIYQRNHIARLMFLAWLAGALPGRRLPDLLIRRNDCLRRLSEADLVASLAGGDSFSDLYGLVRLLYVSLPQFLAVLMNKPLILMPQTLGPFKSPVARFIAGALMRRAREIFSRDDRGIPATLALLGERENRPRLRFCYDTGFLVDPVRPADSDLAFLETGRQSGRWIYGLNISGLLWMGGYTRKNMFALKTDYRKLTREILRFMLSRDNALVLLIPHVFGEEEESDTRAIREAAEPLLHHSSHRLHMPSGNYTVGQIKYLIGRSDFFVGARMHACIAALSQSVPTVSIAYSDKFIGVLQSIGMETHCVDPRTQDLGDILTRLKTAVDRAPETRALLERGIPLVKQSLFEMFSPATTPLDGK